MFKEKICFQCGKQICTQDSVYYRCNHGGVPCIMHSESKYQIHFYKQGNWIARICGDKDINFSRLEIFKKISIDTSFITIENYNKEAIEKIINKYLKLSLIQ